MSSLLLLGAWAWAQAPTWCWWLGLSLALAAAWLGWTAARGVSGQLCWDGAQWRWLGPHDDVLPASERSSGRVGEVKVVFDAQLALLLRWHAASESDIFQPRTAWLWLGHEACPKRWLDLRRAVHGPHRS